MNSEDRVEDILLHYGVKGMKWDKEKKKNIEVYRRKSTHVIDTRTPEGLKTQTANINGRKYLEKKAYDKALKKSIREYGEYKKTESARDVIVKREKLKKKLKSTMTSTVKAVKGKMTNTELKREQRMRTEAALFVRSMSKKQEIRRKEQEDWNNRTPLEKVRDKLKKKKKPKYLTPLNQ